MLKFKIILMAWVIGTVAGIVAYHSFSQEQRLALVALKNGSAISDLPDGQRVMVTGSLDAPYPDLLPLRVNETYQCHDYYYHPPPGQRSSDTAGWRRSCGWISGERFLPPFVLRERANRPPVHIINRDYLMEGPQETITTSATSRIVGWRQGTTMLVIGVTEHGAIRADTVYGGTRLEYLQSYSLIGWIAVLVAGIGWATLILVLFTG